MQKNTKVAAGSAAALAILVAGGLAIALPAQAATDSKSVSVVEPVDATDTDNVQNEVEDGTADGSGTEASEATEATEAPGTEGTETEDTSDDINGVAVEDGHQD